jgi:sulfate adenylyltransferase subunit 1
MRVKGNRANVPSLLSICVKEVIVAVNKMDLVDYSEEVYNKIKADFEALNAKILKEQNVSYIPLSALTGTMYVDKTDAMPGTRDRRS